MYSFLQESAPVEQKPSGQNCGWGRTLFQSLSAWCRRHRAARRSGATAPEKKMLPGAARRRRSIRQSRILFYLLHFAGA